MHKSPYRGAMECAFGLPTNMHSLVFFPAETGECLMRPPYRWALYTHTLQSFFLQIWCHASQITHTGEALQSPLWLYTNIHTHICISFQSFSYRNKGFFTKHEAPYRGGFSKPLLRGIFPKSLGASHTYAQFGLFYYRCGSCLMNPHT